MARIYPFRALRYNPSMVRVEDVVTQPYDKISPAMQQAYYQRSLYNLVRVVLGLPELFDEPGTNDVYTRAARDFADWRRMGILTQEKILFSGTTAPEIEVTDEHGVTHRVWKVSDMSTINILLGAMEDKKLIIADGHHRYETALAYSLDHAPKNVARTERNLANTTPHPAYPEAAVMMTFVNIDSSGITILPTHRVVFGLTDFSPVAFLAKAHKVFDIEPVNAEDAAALTKLLARQTGTAFIAISKRGYHLLKAKPEVVGNALAKLPERQRRLDLTQLHSLGLAGL